MNTPKHPSGRRSDTATQHHRANEPMSDKQLQSCREWAETIRGVSPASNLVICDLIAEVERLKINLWESGLEVKNWRKLTAKEAAEVERLRAMLVLSEAWLRRIEKLRIGWRLSHVSDDCWLVQGNTGHVLIGDTPWEAIP